MASGLITEAEVRQSNRGRRRAGQPLPPNRPPLIDRIAFPAFVIALLFLSFLGGAMVMLSGVFPSGPLSDAYRGGQALVAKANEKENSGECLQNYIDTHRQVAGSSPAAASNHGSVAQLEEQEMFCTHLSPIIRL